MIDKTQVCIDISRLSKRVSELEYAIRCINESHRTGHVSYHTFIATRNAWRTEIDFLNYDINKAYWSMPIHAWFFPLKTYGRIVDWCRRTFKEPQEVNIGENRT